MTDEKIVRKDRDDRGKFVKGHKVPAPRVGRPSRADSLPMLIAVATEAYSSEEIVEMLRETYEKSKEQDDWKGMFQVIQFVVNYAVGKPVQRTLSATVNPDLIKQLFQGGEDAAADDGDVIDVGVDEL